MSAIKKIQNLLNNNIELAIMSRLLIDAILELSEQIENERTSNLHNSIDIREQLDFLNDSQMDEVKVAEDITVIQGEIVELKSKLKTKWVWNKDKTKKINLNTGNQLYWDCDGWDDRIFEYRVSLLVAANDYNVKHTLGEFETTDEVIAYIDSLTEGV